MLVPTATGVKDSKRRFWVAPRLGLILALVPALLLGLLILRYGVDVIEDQWEIAALFEKAANGSLSVADLFKQQAEYRQFFPNLIYLGFGSLTHWNIKFEMFVSFSLACVVVLNLYRLGEVTLDYGDSTRWLATFLSSLLIFSPSQYENWLMGEQILYFVPAVCLTTSLRLLYSKLNSHAVLVLCMLLSTVATFSSANGLVCWVVLAPFFFFSSFRGTRKGWVAIAWVTGFIVNLAVYLYGYHKPEYTPPVGAAMDHPIQALFFFNALLGAPLFLISRLKFVSVALGAAMLVLFVTAFRYVWQLHDNSLRQRAGGWLVLGAYSVATAVIVMVARVGYGPEHWLVSRYNAFSVYLLVSLCWLAPLLLTALKKGSWFRERRKSLYALTVGTLAVLFVAHTISAAAGIQHMALHRTQLLQTKACLLYVDVVVDECLAHGFPDRDTVVRRMDAMNHLGYLRPALIKSNRISDVADVAAPGVPSNGRFEGITRVGNGAFLASGRATLPGRGEPADAVLLTYDDEQGQPLVFALGQVTARKPSLSQLLSAAPSPDAHWHRLISLEKLPVRRPLRISTWAFDALAGKAYRIEGDYVISASVAVR